MDSGKTILSILLIILIVVVAKSSYDEGYANGYSDCKVEYESKIETIKTIPIETNQKTEVAYIPKENQNDVDVQLTDNSPKITASYNGKIYEFDSVENESSKFEKGKLVVEKQSEVKIDVSEIVNEQMSIMSESIRESERKKQLNASRIGVGVGFTENSQMAGLKYENNRIEYFGFKRVSGSGDDYFIGAMWNIPCK